ncbi:MAG: hypothetical protein IJ220_06990 [Clostridia bacterium]|nr:hypothetical protein [Clostridia bacterium]
MKIYLIDNTRKLKKVGKELQEYFNIETKENCKFKMTKNDYVILSDEVGNLEGLEKLKNIIILTIKKDYKYIWRLVNNHKALDIIDNALDENYIAQRIEKLVRRGL